MELKVCKEDSDTSTARQAWYSEEQVTQWTTDRQAGSEHGMLECFES